MPGVATVPRSPEPRPPLAATLRDGTPVRMRAIRPEDRALLTTGMEHLSLGSRYRRFLSPIARLSEQQLRDFTELDHVNHYAWVMMVQSGSEPVWIGVGRYVRDGDDAGLAEVAITVVDAWQGRGAGTLLVAATALVALDNGIERFHAEVLAENLPMLSVFRRLGGAVTSRQGYLVWVELALRGCLPRLRSALDGARTHAASSAPSP
ncbi:MAG TPA: GNAT family N-acetyltransferase [Candidatus Dormibacteraeota bacterium]|nr:GNAT family N-acetyltransferase [Candidatus Dormibacteraeota bacterium]